MGKNKLSKMQVEDLQNSKNEMKLIGKDLERLYLEKETEETKEKISLLLEEHEILREHIQQFSKTS